MDHTRHIGIFDVSSLSCTVIGAGGIGAITALALAKMGVGFLNVIDGDVVSDVNIATQFHAIERIGEPKVDALKAEILRYADGTDILPTSERMEKDGHLFGNVVISAVDSIASRKAIWAAVCRGKVRWYIDARMAAEEYHQYTVDMEHGWDWYNKIISREDDANVPDLACTEKATFYTACFSAGHIGKTVRMIATGRTPARYVVHNIIADNLLAMRE
jgi:molybdopterin/thiamine biosynthesis adenylyltransferase